MTSSGYTLPVWVTAAAVAAVQRLRGDAPLAAAAPQVLLWLQPHALIADQQPVAVAVEGAALLAADRALG
ncbi:MAG: cobalt-precorrin-5B (C(1))-methyltransferase, partial [Vulcanococcus sp.]